MTTRFGVYAPASGTAVYVNQNDEPVFVEDFQRDMVIDDDSISGVVFGTVNENNDFSHAVWRLNLGVNTDKTYMCVEKWTGEYDGSNSENYALFDINDTEHYVGDGIFSIPFIDDEFANTGHLSSDAHLAIRVADVSSNGASLENIETREFDLSDLEFEANMEG